MDDPPEKKARRWGVGRFLGELKRRKVFRVLVGYSVGAWLLIQVAETIFPYVGLPDAAVTLVIVLTVAGLPVALVLSWIFDITPEGVEATAPSGAPATDDAALREGHPPLRRAPLPVPATPLVGREDELAEAERLLTDQRVRLVTVLGTGGSGKTRLALELAHRLAPRFQEGAAWVALDAVRDPGLVPSAIARAFDMGETAGEDLTASLAQALEDRELLLVLDNFEQVADAAHHLAALLAACPRLTLLVTSRAPLRIRGERELPLHPLSTPDPSQPSEKLMASPAVRLFADRARDVNPDFEVTPDNAAAVAAICRRLDGLPLALELAAARTKILPPEALLTRLDQRMPVLAAGGRDQPAHQRTLHDTIAWSHDLLRPAERALFRRLAVFAGGAELDAVEAVAGPGLDGDVLDLLQALVDQSLVVPVTDASGIPRFTMLEVIRAYAADALAESEDDALMRERHARYFADLARAAEPELVGPDQAAWLDRLEREHDNLRAALDWMAPRDPGRALHLAVTLWRFWEMHGHLTEGRGRLDSLLASQGRESDGKLLPKALYAAGVLADAQGDYDRARDRFEETLSLYRDVGDRWGVANALNNMGVMALRHGDHEEARRLYTRSVSLWRELGNDAAVALALNNLGNAARLQGDHDAARASLHESLAMQQAAGETNGCALTLGLLAEVARDEGRLDEAEDLVEESLALFRETGNRPQIGRSLLELARVRRARGHSDQARGPAVEALREYAEIGNPRGLAETLDQLAALAGDQQDKEARDHFAAAARALEQGRPVDLDGLVADASSWRGGQHPGESS